MTEREEILRRALQEIVRFHDPDLWDEEIQEAMRDIARAALEKTK